MTSVVKPSTKKRAGNRRGPGVGQASRRRPRSRPGANASTTSRTRPPWTNRERRSPRQPATASAWQQARRRRQPAPLVVLRWSSVATCAPVVVVATAGRRLRAWSGTRPALAPTVHDPLPWLECPLKPRTQSRSFCVCGWPRAGRMLSRNGSSRRGRSPRKRRPPAGEGNEPQIHRIARSLERALGVLGRASRRECGRAHLARLM